MKVSSLRKLVNLKQKAANIIEKRHIYICPSHKNKTLNTDVFRKSIESTEKTKSVSFYLNKRKMTAIDKQFDNLVGSFRQECWYRGVLLKSDTKAYQLYNNAKPGDVIKLDNTYIFMSKYEDVANNYAYFIKDTPPPSAKAFIFHITTKPGTKISRNPKHLAEGVLKSNSTVVVDKVEEDAYSSKILYVTTLHKKKPFNLYNLTDKIYNCFRSLYYY